ncbi:MAG: hypothetical protein F4Y49_03000 [Dehalococcoidia bacterium]|nr:hypothetical protein [Dehalococcoidia bacterium]
MSIGIDLGQVLTVLVSAASVGVALGVWIWRMNRHMEQRLERQMERQMDGLERRMNERVDRLDTRMDGFDDRLRGVETGLSELTGYIKGVLGNPERASPTQ